MPGGRPCPCGIPSPCVLHLPLPTPAAVSPPPEPTEGHPPQLQTFYSDVLRPCSVPARTIERPTPWSLPSIDPRSLHGPDQDARNSPLVAATRSDSIHYRGGPRLPWCSSAWSCPPLGVTHDELLVSVVELWKWLEPRSLGPSL